MLLSTSRFSLSQGTRHRDSSIGNATWYLDARCRRTTRTASAPPQHAGALTSSNSQKIADLALTANLPSVHAFRHTVASGGLMSLGPDSVEMARQGAGYVDKILFAALFFGVAIVGCAFAPFENTEGLSSAQTFTGSWTSRRRLGQNAPSECHRGLEAGRPSRSVPRYSDRPIS
jgi:hypothetical protein